MGKKKNGKQTSVYLDNNLHEFVVKEAARQDRSISWIIERGIEKLIEAK